MSPDGSTKSPLPEERLLKLIRGKGPRPEAGAPAAPPPGTGKAVSVVATIGSSTRASGPPWPRLAMACLGALLGIEVVVLIVQAVRPVPTMAVPVAVHREPVVNESRKLPQEDVPSLAASAPRPLFTSSPTATSTSPSASPVAPPSGSAKLLAARLTLLGVIAGNPAQAIIEDSQTKKTYFVTTGQSVVEGAVLEQVLENHVILDLQGEKIDLTL